MKNISHYTSILLFFVTTTLLAQTPTTIVKGVGYAGTINETLIATESIVLGAGVSINTGSTFVAKISSDVYIAPVFSNENYIFTRIHQERVKTYSEIANNKDVIERITYFDGLGRPMQNIAIKGAPIKQDILTHIEYDNFGRQEKDYLPYMETTGAIASYRGAADINTNRYYISNYPSDINASASNPFSQKQFDGSPLNRVLQQAGPGNDWSLTSNHTVKMDYQGNTDLDAVKLYTVTTTLDGSGVYNPTIVNTTNYGANQLYKTIIKDENWASTDGKNKTTIEFKDKEGHIILKRAYSNYTDTQGNTTVTEVSHDTYYVYDQYNNLAYVLPPKADGLTDILTLNNLCYQYKYDSKNRLIEKKLPGKEWEYIVYDKLDRPILTQDANLKAVNKWIFTKYDAFNRPVYTGEYVNARNTTRGAVQTLANAATTLFETKQGFNTINGSTVYYSNNAFPNTGIDLFTINYYDDYNFDLNGGGAEAAYNIAPITNAKGLTTGIKIRILGQTTWTTNVIYYETKGRSIYNYSKNDFLSTTTKVKSQLDFVGKILETTSTHTRAGVTTSIVDTFVYDHAGRLLSQKQKVNAQPDEIIVANTYDNLGQLTSKGIGGKTTQNRLQTVDYAYNIRGWLKAINNVATIGSDLFAFKINYNGIAAGVTPLYNGNIGQTQWKTASVNTTGNPVSNSYAYNYDGLNRLTMATDSSNLTSNRYNESLSYDKNGNILGLLRKGNTDANATIFGTMDNLVYTYDTGNKLVKVEDSSGSTEGFKNGSTASTEYTYDDNGNMISDLNKNISTVAYNYLNLPTQVTIGGANINYAYDATGVKQRKTVNGITTDYAGGFIYENNVMKFFSQPEGYVANNAGIFSYIYQYKDHLGNVRLSYGDGNSDGVINTSEIVEENNYYPFGLKQKGYNSVATSTNPGQKYKFNGKELQDDDILGFKLNLYDYGARNYDPALGRWMNIDPLAETSRRFSPYAYALNNPVYFIDPDGMQASSMINGRYNSGRDFVNDRYKNSLVNSPFENPEASLKRGAEEDDKQQKDLWGNQTRVTADGLEEVDENGNDNIASGPKPKRKKQKIKVIDSNQAAVDNYYIGDGSPVVLGPKTKRALLNSSGYKRVISLLANGTARSRTNSFDVDLTFAGAFQIGRTNVDYATSCTDGCCRTTFKAFARDSFSDPLGLGIEVPSMSPFGQILTPKPYSYIPYIFTMEYDNPGYPIGNNIK